MAERPDTDFCDESPVHLSGAGSPILVSPPWLNWALTKGRASLIHCSSSPTAPTKSLPRVRAQQAFDE